MEKHAVTAISLSAQSEFTLTIEIDEDAATGDFAFSTYVEGNCISVSEYGYFEAFQVIRDELLDKGYGMKCVGAKLNAVQSSMSSATDSVYLVTLGRQALRSDLMSIYEYAEIDEFPNTEKQSEFFEKWIKSLR